MREKKKDNMDCTCKMANFNMKSWSYLVSPKHTLFVQSKMAPPRSGVEAQRGFQCSP